LFYKYDALAHFQYNQNNPDPLSMADLETRFIHYNALGEAIRQQKRVVVLIDEIDKAPRDLPNDVLFAIEKLRFRIPELNNKTYESVAAARPIIVITSNSEKNLPDAFLRRVIFYHIPFPSEANLIQILSAKTDGFTEGELKSVVQHFQDVRDLKLKKSPATAELIYWALLLKQMNFPMQKLGSGSFSAAEKGQLLISYAVLAKNREDLEVLKGNI
jgi:MoxR-like ATPase